MNRNQTNTDSTLLAMVLDPGGWLRFGEEENGEESLYLKIDEKAPNEMKKAPSHLS